MVLGESTAPQQLWHARCQSVLEQCHLHENQHQMAEETIETSLNIDCDPQLDIKQEEESSSKRCLALIFSMQLLKKHTLSPEIALLNQFHAQKALSKPPKICKINFWIENDPSPPPLELFRKFI